MLRPTEGGVRFGVGAGISAAWGVWVLWWVWTIVSSMAISELESPVEYPFWPGSLDAMIATVVMLIVAGLALVAAVVINRRVASMARGAGGRLLTLHRAHSVALLALPPLVVALPGVGLAAGLSIRTFVLLSLCVVVLFGVQFLLLSVILALCAIPRPRDLTA